MMIKFSIWCCFLTIILTASSLSLPVDLKNAPKKDIKNKELLPPDHVAGGHMEHDGHINKDFHHEAFLGTVTGYISYTIHLFYY